MKGFIIYATYRIKDNKAYVHFFGRLENGESFQAIFHTKPYFFIKKKDVKRAKKATKIPFDTEETTYKDFHEHPVTKITVDIPQTVPRIRKELETLNIPCYEADIRFVYRQLIDKNILGCVDISGDYEAGKYVNRLYAKPIIIAATIQQPKVVIASIDIETNPAADAIFSIALVAKNYITCRILKHNLIVSKKPVPYAVHFEKEKAMLQHLTKLIHEIDPDIITGWNVIDFDFRVLRDRYKANGLSFSWARTEDENKLRIESEFFKESTADVPGRQVLDGIALLKHAFIKLDDYKLDTAAETFLGEKKAVQFTGNKAAEIEAMYKKEPEKLVIYNQKDAELVLKIFEAKDLINLSVTRSMLTGMQIDRVSASIASLDSLYIREAKKRGYVCNSAQYGERGERIKGGFVRDSIPGIYDYVIICDFKSLYPSIIRTFNIDPLSFQKDGTIIAPNGARFRNESGILPVLIQRLWEQRDLAKKRKDDVASYAIKITMNSFFGVIASPLCRFYSIEMGNAVTYWGQAIVKETADELKKEGYNVIYGDTDSIFIEAKVHNYKEAKDIGERISEKINVHFKKKINAEYKRESFLELEFEKVYKRFLMPKIRGTEVGAKKRYAGLKTDGKKEELDVVGLETVRRDWTDAAKFFQTTILNKIFAKKDPVPFIKKFVQEIKDGKHDKLLIYKKALRKEVGEYIKTTPPHVKAARLLDKIESTIIEYYITKAGPQPLQKLTSPIDYDHYINKQIKPIADQILAFFNQKFEDIISGKRQSSLFDYSQKTII